MNLYITEIKAVCPKTGEVKLYCGPDVPGINIKTAQEYCENNGLGYCKVIGQLVMEVPCIENTNIPDWKNKIDYDKENLN